MGDLSAHFSRREFDCKDGTRAAPDAQLILNLERLRHACGGRPLRIVSGYRTVGYNQRVGGAPRSQHIFNRAADIERGYASVDQAIAAGFTGIGFKGSDAVHLDVRPGRRVLFAD